MNTRFCTVSFVLALALLTPLRAGATCVAPTTRAGSSAAALNVPSRAFSAAPVAAALTPDDSDSSIVGLWNTTFFAGDGPQIWDQAFEQWHSDGTELALDNAVPPLLGNICLGTWKQVGKTISLRHLGWNWDLDSHLAGTFQLTMTVTVDRDGKSFSGNYVSDSFDLDGHVIPDLHAEGVVRGQRIAVK